MRLPKHCLKLASSSGVNVPASPAHHQCRICSLLLTILSVRRLPWHYAGKGLLTSVVHPFCWACHHEIWHDWSVGVPGRMPAKSRWHEPKDEQEASACAGNASPPATAAASRPLVSGVLCRAQAFQACLRLCQSCRGSCQCLRLTASPVILEASGPACQRCPPAM